MSTIGVVSTGTPTTVQHAEVLVVDFGAQYAQLIARRVREHRVLSRIVPHRITADEVAAAAPAAIVLSGGPKSVHVDGAPTLDPTIYDLGIPILGICYGAQLIAEQLGGRVGRGMNGEYGRAVLERSTTGGLLGDTPRTQDVWMSHFDAIVEVPDGFTATAATPMHRLPFSNRRRDGSGVCNITLRWCIRPLAPMCCVPFCTTSRLSPPTGRCRR